jgi:hypothetical protein
MHKPLAVFGLLLLFVSTVAAQGSSGSWLRGSWEGTGYQTDDNTTWAMQLTVAKRKNGRHVFKIDYPSLNCGGRWRLLSSGQNIARFREVLDHGADKCSNKGIVTIERKGAQLVFLYRNEGDREMTSSAILNRKKRATSSG